MSVEEAETPKYIVTAPEHNTDDGEDDEKSSTAITTTAASTVNTMKSTTTTNTKKTQSSARSLSLQSSSTSATSVYVDQQSSLNSSLIQQSKAQSSVNIVTEKHIQKMSSTSISASGGSSSSTTKNKFTSFLQHPDSTSSHHGATFLTAQQKHVRQFVRSTSAHSSTDGGSGAIAISGRNDKCIRSTSQQIDDDHFFATETLSKGLQQSAAILISKSAETIEGSQLRSCSSTSGSMRTQLTIGNFLAPPNRKLTILSPIHAPPGLQELLKRHRSPLSPRISFPGTEAELFP